MKNLKTLTLIAILFVTSSTGISQSYQVPEDYAFETKEDHKDAEEDILECIDFLETTPLNIHTSKRKEASGFLMTWLTGSPNVNIDVTSTLMGLTKGNSSLTFIYFGGFTKYIINNPSETDGRLAGTESLLQFYQSNIGNGIQKNKKVEKLIKLQEKGELENWVKSHL